MLTRDTRREQWLSFMSHAFDAQHKPSPGHIADVLMLKSLGVACTRDAKDEWIVGQALQELKAGRSYAMNPYTSMPRTGRCEPIADARSELPNAGPAPRPPGQPRPAKKMRDVLRSRRQRKGFIPPVVHNALKAAAPHGSWQRMALDTQELRMQRKCATRSAMRGIRAGFVARRAAKEGLEQEGAKKRRKKTHSGFKH